SVQEHAVGAGRRGGPHDARADGGGAGGDGRPEQGPRVAREWEDRIRALKSRNGRQPDPAEQRRSVLVRASGGHHARCLDIGKHVTATAEGSGTSAKRTRGEVPLTGTPDRCAEPGTCLPPPP